MLPAVSRILETALLQEVGGTGSIVPVIHSHFLLPHRAGLQPHRWALLLPRAGCLAPAPVLSAAHLPFTVGSRNLKAQGPMMVKPGPTRQAGGRVGGPQHGHSPHPHSRGTHGWAASGLPGHCTASLARPVHHPWGRCSCPRKLAMARPCPIRIIPRARRLLDCSLRACGLAPLPSIAPHHARLTPAEPNPKPIDRRLGTTCTPRTPCLLTVSQEGHRAQKGTRLCPCAHVPMAGCGSLAGGA